MKNVYDYLNDVEMDFSFYHPEQLLESEVIKMKNTIKNSKKVNFKKIGTVAACIAVLCALTLTAPAKEFIGNIIRTVTTGHNQFSEIDPNKLPELYVGLLFDEDGNEVTDFHPETDKYFDKNGNEIKDVYKFLQNEYERLAEENGWLFKAESSDSDLTPLERAEKNGQNIVRSIDEINLGLNFTSKLPTYLPEDFKFDFATADGDYLFLYYTNADGEYFTVHERVINEDTAYAAGAQKLEEIEIGTNKAVIMDGSSVDWECDGISVSVLGRGHLSRNELIAVAESIN